MSNAYAPSLIVYSMLFVSLGCSSTGGVAEPTIPRDAGLADGGVTDAGRTDSGPRDSGVDQKERLADEAFTYLEGRFDSSDQAAADRRYFAVQLHVCEVDAPDVGARVLYVEQALMTSLDRPYRQRIYVVEPTADLAVASRVYTIADEGDWIGACDSTAPRTLVAGDISERTGCAVFLRWAVERFVGGTNGQDCISTLNGSSYATSEVEMTATEVRSWDRGFDARDEQVWGAEAGAYVFVRRP